MKHLVLLVFVLFLSQTLISQEYQKGDTLYVWRDIGLPLQNKGERSSDVMLTLPYGSMIIFIERNSIMSGSNFEFNEIIRENDTLPAIQHYGYYAKVRYNENEGYIWTAYLSKLPPIRIFFQNNSNYYATEKLSTYFERNYGILKIMFQDTIENTDNSSQRIIFNNGIILNESQGTSWRYNYYILPDFTYFEVYLLVNIYTQFERNYKKNIEYDPNRLEFMPIYFKRNECKLQTGSFETTIIKKDNPFIFLSMGGGN